MSTNTTNMAMGKAVDADNARTYLETTLASALDKIDAHDHSGTTKGITTLTGLTSVVIASGSPALSITAGGITVTAGGVTVTGNSTITGTLGGLTGLTVASGTVSFPGGANAFVTSGTLTNGSGVQTGTLTNAPIAGNPTKWIPISDNGVTRLIPTW